MGKPAPKAALAEVLKRPDAPAQTAASDRSADATPAHPAHQPKRTGTPSNTHDPGQPRDTTAKPWADLHPQRIWPD